MSEVGAGWPLILGLETSCDETAAAVVRGGREVWSSVVASQHGLHERYAGVVPEIASRAHLERLLPVVTEAVEEAGIGLGELSAVAVGHRPGLVGSLIVGVAGAKALSWSLGVPLLGVDHVRAHLHAASLRAKDEDEGEGEGKGDAEWGEVAYPAVGLVVSGGHTSLYRMDSASELTVLGRTIDDALGEAYDKAGVMLEAGYPGGPAVDRLAQRGDAGAAGVPRLPESMLGRESLDFSFSGLKTALLYAVRGRPEGRGKSAAFTRSAADLSEAQRADLAAAFQRAAVGAVVKKLGRAVDQMEREGRGPGSVVLGGGVSANSALRAGVLAWGAARGLGVHLPALGYCVDNAAMIAGYGAGLLARGETAGLDLAVVATSRG